MLPAASVTVNGPQPPSIAATPGRAALASGPAPVYSKVSVPNSPIMTRIAILGATGYTALELIKISSHPSEIVAVTSRQEGNPDISMITPRSPAAGPAMEDLAPPRSVPGPSASSVACRTGPARPWSPRCWPPLPRDRLQRRLPAQQPRGLRPVVRQKHTIPTGSARWSTACPSCSARRSSGQLWPTRAVTRLGDPAAGPLVEAGLVSTEDIIVDSKSGVSGAGRDAQAHDPLPRVQREHRRYNVGRHRHTPEIEQVLSTRRKTSR